MLDEEDKGEDKESLLLEYPSHDAQEKSKAQGKINCKKKYRIRIVFALCGFLCNALLVFVHFQKRKQH